MLTISEIYQSHYKRLLSVASRVGVPWAHCEDVAQEAVIAVWRHGYQRITASLLYVAVRNAAVDWMRSDGRTPPMCETGDIADRGAGDDGEQTMRLSRVSDALNRTMATQYLVDGCTLQDVGSANGMSRQAATKRIHRAALEMWGDGCIIQLKTVIPSNNRGRRAGRSRSQLDTE